MIGIDIVAVGTHQISDVHFCSNMGIDGFLLKNLEKYF